MKTGIMLYGLVFLCHMDCSIAGLCWELKAKESLCIRNDQLSWDDLGETWLRKSLLCVFMYATNKAHSFVVSLAYLSPETLHCAKLCAGESYPAILPAIIWVLAKKCRIFCCQPKVCALKRESHVHRTTTILSSSYLAIVKMWRWSSTPTASQPPSYI